MADPLLSRHRALLAKIEAAYKADPNAAPADDAVQTVGLQVAPLDAEYAPLDEDRAILGARAQALTIARAGAKFGAYLAASGDAGSAPAWGPLLRACGFSETATAGNRAGGKADNAALRAYYGKVEYKPVSAAFESIWLDAFIDRNRHAMAGCRGTFELAMNSGELPMLNFDFQGLWRPVATAARPSLDVSGFKAPRAVTFAATPACSLHGVDVVLNKLTISCGNDLQHVDDPGDERIALVGREVTGSIAIQLPLASAKDWFAAARSVTTGALKVVHGEDGATDATYGAGAIVEVSAPKAQVTNPRIGESKGRHMLEMDLRLLPDGPAGNDELSIVTR